jgi:cobalt-zinc-cadmium efflux system membrane fusion protein
MFAAIGAASAPNASAQTPVPLGTMSQPLRVAVLDAGAHLPILNSTSDQDGNPAPVIPDTAPHDIIEGRLIRIPQGSPLRGELTVAAVAAKEIQRRLALTGVVEADPSRTVQVLAPVPGRVIDVKIQLGDRVARDQELALVYAGVAQTNSRDRRGQSTPALPNELTGSDRQTGSRSDLSAAANDCQRAEAEPLRSTRRLCALVMPAEGLQETLLSSLRAPWRVA